jgi:predicted HicB family RNase H-like nuclease
MLKQIDKAIDEQNEEYLQRCIADLFNQTKEISKDFYPRIEKLLVDKWHHEHEDIVGMIWLKDLKDDRFVTPILTIAEQGEIYRPFDGELESTLRKCVHALKTIGTEQSKLALARLISSGNENVKYALENYQ